MTDSVDYSLLAAFERNPRNKLPEGQAQAPDKVDLDAGQSSSAGESRRNDPTRWKAIPRWILNEPAGMYFEVYRTEEVCLTSILRSGGEWRWRFCSSNGAVQASSSAYAKEKDCLAAVDALRSGARVAELRQSPAG